MANRMWKVGGGLWKVGGGLWKVGGRLWKVGGGLWKVGGCLGHERSVHLESVAEACIQIHEGNVVSVENCGEVFNKTTTPQNSIKIKKLNIYILIILKIFFYMKNSFFEYNWRKNYKTDFIFIF